MSTCVPSRSPARRPGSCPAVLPASPSGAARSSSILRREAGRKTRGSLSSLLSRYAECIFWLARFVERAENLARILDVNETFSRDSRGGQNWRSIVQLNSDEERFFATHPAPAAHSVVNFYVIDGDNPTSIVSTIRYARENARTLRPLISTEWGGQLK